MLYKQTTATKKIFNLQNRIRGISGGTSASKTISILLWLIDYAQSTENKEVISVVSESMPHLRRGAMRDFLNIMQGHHYFRDINWDKTNSIYTFENGSIIEFFGVESWEKVKGGRRDILFINEANHITFETFNQLEIRTKKIIWLDWNPENEFWWYTDILNRRNDIGILTLTYKDNEALEESIIRSIESRQSNTNWFKVYGLGELGEIEAKIYKDWQIIDEIPHEARLERYGLDFGYSNDPSAIVAVYYYNGGYILDEIIYQKGMSNKQIADVFLNSEKALVKADSAEPKSIDEIKMYGVNVLPCTKGKDSVTQGIQYVQSQKISITKRSLNLIKEYRNYMWQTDRDGKIINVPEDRFNHAMDCLVKGTLIKTKKGNKPIEKITTEDYVYTREGLRKVKDSWKVRDNAEVIKITLSNGLTLIGTPNHRVWTTSGWKLLTDIRYGDILQVWKDTKIIKGEDILSTPVRENFIIIMESISCIEKYIKTILDRFQRGFMSIIRMGSKPTTDQKILKLSIKEHTENIIGENANLSKKDATVVEENSNVIHLESKTDSALINARVNGGGLKKSTLFAKDVCSVENNSRQINTIKPHTVLASVLTRQELKDRYTVYDIAIDDCNEYFAGDILVHNSVRYGLENHQSFEQYNYDGNYYQPLNKTTGY